MKRISFVLLLLSLLLSFIAAEKLGSQKDQEIVGYVDTVNLLTVTPSSNNTFDVTATDVQQKDGFTGLLIGTWSVLSNNPNATLNITANPLQLSTDTSKIIPYQLGIQYPDEVSSANVTFVDCSTTSVSWKINGNNNYPLPATSEGDETEQVVSWSGMGLYIRIQIAKDKVADITNGTYNGSISFTLSST